MEKQMLEEQTDVFIETENEITEDEIEKKQKPIGVYVKTNQDGFIVDVNSDVFIRDLSDWQKIDEGYGDKFAHAQSQYFESGLTDEYGCYCYLVPDGVEHKS